MGRTSAKHKEPLLAEYGPFCWGCGADYDFDPRGLEVDHIRPKVDGGSDDYENMALLCRPCNIQKGSDYTLTGLRNYNRKHGLMKGPINEWQANSDASDMPNAVGDEEYIDGVLRDLGRAYLLGELDPFVDYASWEIVSERLYQAAMYHKGVVSEWSQKDLAYAFHRKAGIGDTKGFHPARDLAVLYPDYVDKMQEAWIEKRSSPAGRPTGGLRDQLRKVNDGKLPSKCNRTLAAATLNLHRPPETG